MSDRTMGPVRIIRCFTIERIDSGYKFSIHGQRGGPQRDAYFTRAALKVFLDRVQAEL